MIFENLIEKIKNYKVSRHRNILRKQKYMIKMLHIDLHNQKVRNIELIHELYRQEDLVNALTKKINEE